MIFGLGCYSSTPPTTIDRHPKRAHGHGARWVAPGQTPSHGHVPFQVLPVRVFNFSKFLTKYIIALIDR
jgi:hypothetical protein